MDTISHKLILQSDVDKIKKELKTNYNFIKYDGLVLDKFAEYLLQQNSINVVTTIAYLDTLTKKDILDKFYTIIKELETSNEIMYILKNKIQIEELKLKQYSEISTQYESRLSSVKDNIDLLKKQQINLENTNKILLDTINGIYINELYENEYNIPKCDYILEIPQYNRSKVIYINNQKFLDIKDFNKFKEELVITSSNTLDYTTYIDKNNPLNYLKTEKQEINLNFPINIKFENDDEYVIKVYFINNTKITKHEYSNFMIYLTNYGRFIKSDIIVFNKIDVNDSTYNGPSINKTYTIQSKINNIDNKTLYKYSYEIMDITRYHSSYCGGTNKIPVLFKNIIDEKDKILMIMPNLNFRIPKLFIDIIDAFYSQNNELMQTCCKNYLNITKESESKKELLLSLELNKRLKDADNIIKKNEIIIKDNNNAIMEFNKQLKQNDDMLKIKNENIEEKDKIILQQTNEIERLKSEIIKIKSALSNIF